MYTIDVPPGSKVEINRRRNANLVQTRVPPALVLQLRKTARGRKVTLSALVASILTEWSISVAAQPRRG